MKTEHEHQFKRQNVRLLVHSYDNKFKKKGASTATDTLKQWACECGNVQTYDLERVKR